MRAIKLFADLRLAEKSISNVVSALNQNSKEIIHKNHQSEHSLNYLVVRMVVDKAKVGRSSVEGPTHDLTKE